MKLRENFAVQKMWSQFYKMKMNKEMKRSQQVEEAFQKIRTDTGITDVQEIVHKFLSREQTYAQLLRAVSEHEQRLEVLKRASDLKREELHVLQIEHNNLVKNDLSRLPDKEITALSSEIEVLEHEVETLNARKKKIHLVTD